MQVGDEDEGRVTGLADIERLGKSGASYTYLLRGEVVHAVYG